MGSHEVPTWWEVASLSEVSSKVVDGSHNPPAKQKAGFPMLSAVNINDNKIIFSDYRFISEEAFLLEDKRTRISSGDVLLTIVGAIGRAAVVPETTPKFTLQRSVAVITPLYIDSKFLMYQLGAPRVAHFFKNNARGTAQKGVYLKTLGSTEIWLPPLNEQHRIVAKIEELFSELDAGIESLKTAQAQLKVYRQSLLKHSFEGKLTEQWREQNKDKLESSEALLAHIQTERANRYQQQLKEWEAAGKPGSKPKAPKPLSPLTAEELVELPELPEGWGWELIGRFAEVKGGKRLPAGADYTEHQTNHPYIRVVDFENFGVRKTDLKYLSEETQAQISAYTISSKDTYISIAGTIGRVGTIPDSLDGANLTENAAKICEQCLVDKKYLALWLHSVGGNAQLVEKTISTTQPKLALFRIEKVSVPVCSIAEQALIVQHIESCFSEIDQLELTITASLRRAEALRQSILNKAFSGQLVPQDPNDEPASILLARIKAEKAAQPKSKKVPA